MASPPDTAQAADVTPPEEIKAIPVRHPGRWVAIAALAVLAAMLVNSLVTNPRFRWDTVGRYLFDQRVVEGVRNTLILTVVAMLAGVTLGIVLAVMRLSPNPVLSSVAWLYLWIFRGTPVYTQLVFWGLIGVLYPKIGFGIPFGPEFVTFATPELIGPFVAALLGLALNEAAYMAEIVRAGILSVGEGQIEAASALGMKRGLLMRRVVLPQAMRVIIPPTGNETISMLKTTSLVVAVPYTLDLYSRTRDVSIRLFQPVPMLIVAGIWYLAITSVLMVGQYYLERHYARGSQRALPLTPLQKLRRRLGGGEVGPRERGGPPPIPMGGGGGERAGGGAP
ncbi:MAG TPA: amino acid ABC transporter permease [Mycobacteriales bacterium]|nr:amino acid ABC transporter permease [Mycobacteriales bacterium]